MVFPDSADTPNPANSIDDQNFDVDINGLYKDWIVPLDNLRSFASINDQNAGLIEKSKISNFKQIATLIKPETTLQESRCHAFYRWVGFPVFGNGQIYNPGFDIIKSPTRQIKDETKNTIANKPKEGFNKLSQARENFSQTMAAIFSKPGSADSGVLALSSGGNKTLRKFIVPLEKNTAVDPFDMTVSTYKVDFTVRVGKYFSTLDQFADKNGKEAKSVKDTRTHIIIPFMVDARIDFAVSPQTRLVAVPFVPDSAAQQVGPEGIVKVRRPLLERIIRRRFKVDDAIQQAGTAVNSLKKIVADFPDIKDDALIKLANESNTILKVSENIQLNIFINIIRSMMEKLVAAQETIKEAQSKYYWFPSPSVSGPEGGSSVLGVFLPTVIDPDRSKQLITPSDWSIFLAEARGSVNTVTSDGNAATGEPDNSAYGLASDTVTFDPDTTASMGDNNDTSLDGNLKRRFQLLTDASEALKVIEMIMGDFSGFGLCDIIAIMGALNVIPKENLLGFLDPDALVRAQTAMKEIKDATPADYNKAQQDLVQSVKDFYNLMDKIYLDVKSKGKSI